MVINVLGVADLAALHPTLHSKALNQSEFSQWLTKLAADLAAQRRALEISAGPSLVEPGVIEATWMEFDIPVADKTDEKSLNTVP